MLKALQTPRSPRHLSFSKGKLRAMQSESLPKFSTISQYAHTVRETPDQYHIEAIKQYKRELDEMRKNYEELKRLYYYLLGYRIDGDDRVPKLTLPSAKLNTSLTEVSEGSALRYSDINEALSDIADNTKRLDRLAERMTESIIEFQPDYLKMKDIGDSPSPWKHKQIKTENDEDVLEQLQAALRENKELRSRLQNSQPTVCCATTDEHIKKLEEILARQRCHTKMLNGVIEKMREELQSKEKCLADIVKLHKNNYQPNNRSSRKNDKPKIGKIMQVSPRG